MWEAIENILVNNAAWPYEKDYWERDFLWDDGNEDEEDGTEDEEQGE